MRSSLLPVLEGAMKELVLACVGHASGKAKVRASAGRRAEGKGSLVSLAVIEASGWSGITAGWLFVTDRDGL